MPELKLTYFGLAGRAEPIRWALHHGQVDFEDIRVTHDGFLELKPKLSTGQLPVMHIDGEELPQSLAQLKYAGKLANLYPEDALEAARVDAALMNVEEISKHANIDNYSVRNGAPRPWTTEEKTQIRKNFANDIFPEYFAQWNKMLEGHEYLANDKLSVADLLLATQAWYYEREILDGIPKSLVLNAPNVRAHQQRIMALPYIEEYLKGINYYNHAAYIDQ